MPTRPARPRATLALALLLATPALAQTPPPTPPTTAQNAALEQALRNFPPLITGANVQPTLAGADLLPRPCPAPGSKVETKGGPPIEYTGTAPDNPELCLMRVGDTQVEAWYAIWNITWPGADYARRGLQRIMQSRTGDVVGFDTIIPNGPSWHDLIRHEGIEDIDLRGTTYKALKLAHYREGFDGNTYRAVRTTWKDIATGIVIYATYQHIAGKPDLDDALVPTAILPAN